MGIVIGGRSTLNETGSGTSVTTTWTGTQPTAGCTVIVLVNVSGGAAVTSVVDNGAVQSTFVQDVSNTALEGAMIFRANNITLPSAGNYAVTVTIGTTHTIMAVGTALTGVRPGAPVSTNTGTATSANVTTNAATGSPNDYYVACFSDNDGGNPSTITFGSNPGFTEFARNTNGSAFWPSAYADGVIAAGGSQTVTWTVTSSTWASAIAVYTAADSPANLSTSLHPGRGTSNRGRFYKTPRSTETPAVTNAPADVATGTGTAYDASVDIGTAAEATSASGTSYDATIDKSGDTGSAPGTSKHPGKSPSFFRFRKSAQGTTEVPYAPADVANGSGTAYDASVDIDPSGDVGTGSGSALDAQAGVAPAADVSTGSGTASNPSTDVDPTSGVSTGTGTSNDGSVSIQVGAEVATGSGTAFDVGVGLTPSESSGSGSAPSPSVDLQVNGDVASGTGAAIDPTVDIQVNGDVAVASGVAYDATVQVVLDQGTRSVSFHPGKGPSKARFYQTPRSTVLFLPGQVPADYASGVGLAFDATIDVAVSADFSTGSITAFDSQSGLTATSDISTGTGTSNDVSASVGASSGVSTGNSTSFDVSASTATTAGSSDALGASLDVSGSLTVPGGVSTGSGASNNGSPDSGAASGVATGQSISYDSSAQIAVLVIATTDAVGVAYVPFIQTGDISLDTDVVVVVSYRKVESVISWYSYPIKISTSGVVSVISLSSIPTVISYQGEDGITVFKRKHKG